jgi:hypothetical protein
MAIFDKLTAAIEKLAQKKPPFDPSIFNDELAMQTAWLPAKSGGTNMSTHSLVEISPKQVEFKARGVALIFPWVFMVLGAGITVAIGMSLGGLLQNDLTFLYFGLPAGVSFFFIGFLILRNYITPRIFDLSTGYYWKGRKTHTNMESVKEHCRLSDIHAIQLLQEYVGNRYYSYELNLVLKDGNRLNVVDHGKLSLIRTDAEQLGQFLNVPVWDATS